jgi:excisionase family DNA binding protein
MSRSSSPQNSDTVFHTIDDIAERWHSSTRHVRRVIKKGDLPVHRFRNLVRVSDVDLRIYEKICRKD